jgi:hypothetical protein
MDGRRMIVETLKFIAAGTAVQLIMWAFILMSPKWPSHEAKPIKREDDAE